MDKRKIDICITTHNRVDFTVNSFKEVYGSSRINSIVIVDDFSDIEIYNQLSEILAGVPNVDLYRNSENKDCYLNKRQCISLAKSEYVAIIDSDNIINSDYLEAIFSQEWDENIILQPSFAKPHFDFRQYAGVTISKENISEYIDKSMFSTLLNASNYFVNRLAYLNCFDDSINPHTAEALFTNYNWLKAGNKIKVIDGMEYFHTVHDGSHYKNNVHLTKDLYQQIENHIRQLK